jgi:hypothetical protein
MVTDHAQSRRTAGGKVSGSVSQPGRGTRALFVSMPAWAFEGRRHSRQAGACEAENRNKRLRMHQGRRHENTSRRVELLAPVAEMSHTSMAICRTRRCRRSCGRPARLGGSRTDHSPRRAQPPAMLPTPRSAGPATPWSRFTPSAARAGCTPRALQCKSVARLFRRALARDAGRARMAPYILPELV